MGNKRSASSWFYNLHCNDDKQYELVYEDQLTKDIYQHFQSLLQE